MEGRGKVGWGVGVRCSHRAMRGVGAVRVVVVVKAGQATLGSSTTTVTKNCPRTVTVRHQRWLGWVRWQGGRHVGVRVGTASSTVIWSPRSRGKWGAWQRVGVMCGWGRVCAVGKGSVRGVARCRTG